MNALGLPPTNPLTRVAMGVLICELIVFALAVPGMILVEHRDPTLAWAFGAIAVLLALAGAVLIKRPVGWLLGWLAQAAALGMGFLTPWMVALAVVFGGLWAATWVLGRRIERDAATRTDV